MGKRGPKGPRLMLSDEDYKKLIAMIRIQCTAEEISGVLGMSADTLDRRLKERGTNFAELYKHHSGEGKVSLRRMQWRAAENGNATMLLWLGKQMLGQRDKHEVSGDQDNPIRIEHGGSALDKLAATLARYEKSG